MLIMFVVYGCGNSPSKESKTQVEELEKLAEAQYELIFDKA
tara:strand:- start:270139 stop:270261 length:123 start_codon:yes stop_codon:yes gene_type:complete